MLWTMVTHRRRRTFLTVLGRYTFAALFIGYFAANAFTGNHGLRAQQDLEQQLTAMKGDLMQLKAERAVWNAGYRFCVPTGSTPTCWMSGRVP